MKRLSANSFTGPRAYFTDFDHRIVAKSVDKESLRRHVERKLKILLLLKSNIICAASHLTSEFTYSILRENPSLLSKGILVPALRTDKSGIENIFEKIDHTQKQEAIAFYNDNIDSVVNWDLVDNSEWFKKQFIKELETEESVIRRALKNVSERNIEAIIDMISSSSLLGRDLVEEASILLPNENRLSLLNFRDLLYHMSGARVVNSESALPQENYIDYDLADLTQKRTRLSEEAILWKLFLELALEYFQRRAIPLELLDVLTFEDILKIREPLLDSEFQNKYDILINEIVCNIEKDSSDLLFPIESLEIIKEKLENTFKAIFEEQIPHFLKK